MKSEEKQQEEVQSSSSTQNIGSSDAAGGNKVEQDDTGSKSSNQSIHDSDDSENGSEGHDYYNGKMLPSETQKQDVLSEPDEIMDTTATTFQEIRPRPSSSSAQESYTSDNVARLPSPPNKQCSSSTDCSKDLSNYGRTASPRPGASFVGGHGPGSMPAWALRTRQQQSSSGMADDNNEEVSAINIENEGTPSANTIGAARNNSIVAKEIDQAELEKEFRENILKKSTLAVPIDENIDRNVHEGSTVTKKYTLRITVLAICLTIIGIIVGVLLGKQTDSSGDESFAPSSSPTTSSSPTLSPAPTIEKIIDRGYLSCGINKNSLGFAGWDNGTERLEGFHVDLCRAIAAALFGNFTDHLEFVDFNSSAYRAALDNVATNESIDLLARGITYTMERDIYLKSVGVGVAFTVPYLYSGLAFAGFPPYIECADNYTPHGDECDNLRICVCEECSNIEILQSEWFPSDRLVRTDTPFDDFADGLCNVIANEKPYITRQRMEKEVPELNTTNYLIGTNLFSKEPLAIVTSDKDPEWTSFCNWILQSLFVGERYNITQDNADNFVKTSLFHGSFENMFIDAIKAVGNYGEMYEKHLSDIMPRKGLDWINNGYTGLIFSLRLGNALTSPALFNVTDSLETIVQRGYIICGISRRDGFGNYDSKINSWSGMDADYCYALSRSISFGDEEPERKNDGNVKFVEVADADEGFTKLSNKSIDVFTGANVTMRAVGLRLDTNVRDDFSFSATYFYANSSNDGGANVALATRQDDTQWSSFVFWVVYSTFYAEENDITKESANEMPKVNLFGSDFDTMFQDAIRAVGNYGEMYTRNIEKYHPRIGTRNEVNAIPFNGQHFPPFGIDP